MSEHAYRTADQSEKIAQLENENARLRRPKADPLPAWAKFLISAVAYLMAAGGFAQAGLFWVAVASTIVGAVLLVCLISWVGSSK